MSQMHTLYRLAATLCSRGFAVPLGTQMLRIRRLMGLLHHNLEVIDLFHRQQTAAAAAMRLFMRPHARGQP